MKQIKNYMIAIAVIATLAGSAYNTTLSKKHTEMSMLNLANITTLANAENPGSGERKESDVEKLSEGDCKPSTIRCFILVVTPNGEDYAIIFNNAISMY